MQTLVRGHVWTLGDNINSESILMSGEEERWDLVAQHVLEFYDPDFAKNVKKGDCIIAGKNFGASSGRPSGAILKRVGVGAIVVESAGNVFYRNTWNIGMPVLVCPAIHGGFGKGDEIEVDILLGSIKNLTTGKNYQAEPTEPKLMDVYKEGGLIKWIKNRKHLYPDVIEQLP